MDGRWAIPSKPTPTTLRATKGAARINKAKFSSRCKTLWLRECTQPGALPVLLPLHLLTLPLPTTRGLLVWKYLVSTPPFPLLQLAMAHLLLAHRPVTPTLSCKPCIFVPRSANSYATPPIAPISILHYPYNIFQHPRRRRPRPTPSLQTIRKLQPPPTSASLAQHIQLQTQRQTRPLPRTSTERTPIPAHRSPLTHPPSSPLFGIFSCTFLTNLSTRVP